MKDFIVIIVSAVIMLLLTACSSEGVSSTSGSIGPKNDPWVQYDVAKDFIYGVDPTKYPDGQTVQLPDGSYVYCQNQCFQYEGMSEAIAAESGEEWSDGSEDPNVVAVQQVFDVDGYTFEVRLMRDMEAIGHPKRPNFTPNPDLSPAEEDEVFVWKTLIAKIDKVVNEVDERGKDGMFTNDDQVVINRELHKILDMFSKQTMRLRNTDVSPVRTIKFEHGVENFFPVEMSKRLRQYWVEVIQYTYDYSTYIGVHRKASGSFS